MSSLRAGVPVNAASLSPHGERGFPLSPASPAAGHAPSPADDKALQQSINQWTADVAAHQPAPRGSPRGALPGLRRRKVPPGQQQQGGGAHGGAAARFQGVPELRYDTELSREVDAGYADNTFDLPQQLRRGQREQSRPYMSAVQELSQPEEYRRRNVRFDTKTAPNTATPARPVSRRVDPALTASGRKKGATSGWHSLSSVFRLVALEVQDKSREQELRRRDMALTFCSLFGVCTMGLSAIVTWYTNPERESGLDGVEAPHYFDLDPSPAGEVVCNALAYLTSLSTLVTLVTIVRYYRLLLDKKRHEWTQQMAPWQREVKGEDVLRAYSFWQSALARQCFAELLIHVVHPMPFMDGTSQFVSIRQKTIYSYLQLWMLLRCYLVCRVLHTIHPAYRKRFEILYNNQELQTMNFKVTWGMTMKLYMYDQMWYSMTFLTTCLFFVFGFALFIIERVEQPTTFGSMDKTLFYCFTTATTIGYGRVKAISKAGRLVTVLLGCYGQILLTFFTAIITNLMEPSKEEGLIRNYVQVSKYEHEYRVAAAMLMQAAWRSSTVYKLNRGLISRQAHESLLQVRKEIAVNRKKKGDEEEERRLGRSTVANPSARRYVDDGTSETSPQTRSQKDTASQGRSDGTGQVLRRQSEVHEQIIERRERRGSNVNVILRLDGHKSAGRSDGTARKSQFRYDMEIVERLNAQAEDNGVSKKGGSGVLGDMMRGVMRDDRKWTDVSTSTRRRENGSLFAPKHKSNFLFEALKNFRRQKRLFAECRLEVKDGVLESNLKEIGSLCVTLSDHVDDHIEDVQMMNDRIHEQLRLLRDTVARSK